MSGVPDGGPIAGRSHTPTFAPGLPRLLLWAGCGVAVATCVAILLLWGIEGPGYLLDLIAAYCF